MRNIIVNIKLYGRVVGVAAWNESRQLADFQYTKDFIRSGLDVSPIMMPLKNKDRIYNFPYNTGICFKGLPGLIADSLPDKYGNTQIDEYFVSKGVATDDINPLDRLCYIGKRGMGALEFEPSQQFKDLNKSTDINIQEITTIAQKIFNDRAQFQELLRQENKQIIDILKVGTSAGGAKPKAIIAYNEKNGKVRSGQVKAPKDYTYWLIKFDGGEFLEYDEICNNPKGIGNIEYAYYLMAKSCKINMMECRLLTEGDSHHFMTKRFDRTDDGEKIHMQTFAALAHYDRDESHSYEQLFEVMRRLNLSFYDQEQIFRRMVFNVAARNNDDHTKNHSFLMNPEGKWSLAPAYDLCYSYNPNGKWTKMHQLSLNGKRDHFEWGDLMAVADLIGIRNGKEIISEIMDVVSEWPCFAKESEVNGIYAEEIKKNLILLKSPTLMGY